MISIRSLAAAAVAAITAPILALAPAANADAMPDISNVHLTDDSNSSFGLPDKVDLRGLTSTYAEDRPNFGSISLPILGNDDLAGRDDVTVVIDNESARLSVDGGTPYQVYWGAMGGCSATMCPPSWDAMTGEAILVGPGIDAGASTYTMAFDYRVQDSSGALSAPAHVVVSVTDSGSSGTPERAAEPQADPDELAAFKGALRAGEAADLTLDYGAAVPAGSRLVGLGVGGKQWSPSDLYWQTSDSRADGATARFDTRVGLLHLHIPAGWQPYQPDMSSDGSDGTVSHDVIWLMTPQVTAWTLDGGVYVGGTPLRDLWTEVVTQAPTPRDDSVTLTVGRETPVDVLQNDDNPGGDVPHLGGSLPAGVSARVVDDQVLLTATKALAGKSVDVHYGLYGTGAEAPYRDAAIHVAVKPLAVTPPAPKPAGPNAADDHGSTNPNEPVRVNILRNDRYSGAAQVALLGNVPRGVRTHVDASKRVVVTAPKRYALDTITLRYRLTDAHGSDVATIRVRIGAGVTVGVKHPEPTAATPILAVPLPVQEVHAAAVGDHGLERAALVALGGGVLILLAAGAVTDRMRRRVVAQ